MDLSGILVAAQSSDLNQRNAAEARLKEWEASALPQFMLALAQELSSEESGRDEASRQLAGLHLKNLLTAREASRAVEKKSRWLAMEVGARAQIKKLCLDALRSSRKLAASAGSQVVAKIGAIELPVKQWPELLDALVKNMAEAAAADADLLKTSTLEALGYLCEELEDESMEPVDTNKILTAIVDGLRDDRVDVVRCAGATALLNALVFTRHNFEVADERNMIMQVVCGATRSANERLRAVAYETLARVASLYYDRLAEYMTVLFQLTLEAIRRDASENVSMMAVEFWSTLCEEELELLEEEEEAEGAPQQRCARYVQQAAPHLVPTLLESTLLRQDEHADADTWNLAAAGAVCLAFVAQTVADDVVMPVLQFFENKIMSANWRDREAAIMAFGQVIDGPKQETLAGPVSTALPVLIQRLCDEHTLVKDTAAWTLARVCEFYAQRISSDLLVPLANALVAALADPAARVAAQASFAIYNLAQACDDQGAAGVKPQTNALSPYFKPFLHALLAATDRADWNENNLRGQAYEAINMLVQSHAADTRPVVLDLIQYIIGKLQATFHAQVLSSDDKEERDQHQSALCSVIQVTTRALDKDVKPFKDGVVEVLVRVLHNQNPVATEEAFMALGALAAAVEAEFEKYLNDVMPYVVRGLQNYTDWQVCNAAVGCAGDLCRALEAKMFAVCDPLVQCLLQDLQNPELNRQVKPNVLSCLGDVALAIGGAFEKYLDITLQMLDQAGQTVLPPQADEDLVDYLNVLREGILEAYTGIIQGLKDGDKQTLVTHSPALNNVFGFIIRIADDAKLNKADDTVVTHAIGLIGDLADVTPVGPASHFFSSEPVHLLLRDHPEADITKYARQKIQNHGRV
mmetsp:Transcript_2708/g.8506  ORF Transcript_2708/g.8506 Transcript_2708/m.8506 type:complete len:866 (-) Transcript_2708:480-3077(-)